MEKFLSNNLLNPKVNFFNFLCNIAYYDDHINFYYCYYLLLQADMF